MINSEGDKMRLSFNERDLLENQIIPTAERWVAEKPGLAEHGAQTLAYWGEFDRLHSARLRAKVKAERASDEARFKVDDLLRQRGLRSVFSEAAE